MSEEFEVKIGRVSLEGVSIAELAAELATRYGVDCDSVKSMWEYRIEKEPPEEE